MKEELISFETAKLARETEFDWLCVHYYEDAEGTFKEEGYEYELNCRNDLIPENWNETTLKKYSAPTQSLLQKWLRETHGIHIVIDCNSSGWFWDICKINGTSLKKFILTNTESGFYNSFEKALEPSLEESLKLIL